MENIVHLIDEGSQKFKYGLLWWFVYPSFHSDYSFAGWLKDDISDKEIHDRLAGPVSYGHYYTNGPIGELITFVKKNMMLFSRFIEVNFDEIDFLSDCLYTMLTDKSYFKRKFISNVWHAANRLMRNYNNAGLCDFDVHVTEIISSYYEAKGIRTACGW